MHPQSQTSAPHTCPHPTCAEPLPGLLWACSAHWQSLPPQLRQGLWGATRQFGAESLAVDAAARSALDFWERSAPAAGGLPLAA